MKIAVSSQGPELDSLMDQRFGRCPYLLLIQTDDMSSNALLNPYANESGGVGSRLASLLVDRDVKVLLTGKVGPNASYALNATKIRVVVDCDGPVELAVKKFLESPNFPGKNESMG
jgi:predicted Fe-Mo cluster-binding NifX family protein